MFRSIFNSHYYRYGNGNVLFAPTRAVKGHSKCVVVGAEVLLVLRPFMNIAL